MKDKKPPTNLYFVVFRNNMFIGLKRMGERKTARRDRSHWFILHTTYNMFIFFFYFRMAFDGRMAVVHVSSKTRLSPKVNIYRIDCIFLYHPMADGMGWCVCCQLYTVCLARAIYQPHVSAETDIGLGRGNGVFAARSIMPMTTREDEVTLMQPFKVINNLMLSVQRGIRLN